MKELTKVHEAVFQTSFEEALSYYKEREPKGEFVLMIEGRDPEEIKKRKRRGISGIGTEGSHEIIRRSRYG